MVTRILPFVFAGLSLVGQPGPHQGHGPMPFMMPLRTMKLTEAQKTSIHKIFESHHASLRAKAEAAADARKAVGDALTRTETSEAQLKALHDTAGAAQFELLREARAIFLEVDPQLTPEQRAKAQDLKATFHKHLDGLRDFAFGH